MQWCSSVLRYIQLGRMVTPPRTCSLAASVATAVTTSSVALSRGAHCRHLRRRHHHPRLHFLAIASVLSPPRSPLPSPHLSFPPSPHPSPPPPSPPYSPPLIGDIVTTTTVATAFPLRHRHPRLRRRRYRFCHRHRHLRPRRRLCRFHRPQPSPPPPSSPFTSRRLHPARLGSGLGSRLR